MIHLPPGGPETVASGMPKSCPLSRANDRWAFARRTKTLVELSGRNKAAKGQIPGAPGPRNNGTPGGANPSRRRNWNAGKVVEEHTGECSAATGGQRVESKPDERRGELANAPERQCPLARRKTARTIGGLSKPEESASHRLILRSAANVEAGSFGTWQIRAGAAPLENAEGKKAP